MNAIAELMQWIVHLHLILQEEIIGQCCGHGIELVSNIAMDRWKKYAYVKDFEIEQNLGEII